MNSATLLQNYLYDHIPLSQAMGVTVVESSKHLIILKAPLTNNINHKHTVFGGSLHSVATLACWSLLHVNIKDRKQDAQIVITSSHTDYLRPVDGDFLVQCSMPDEKTWSRFIHMLDKKGKGRLGLTAQIIYNEKLCLDYKGTFAAIN